MEFVIKKKNYKQEDKWNTLMHLVMKECVIPVIGEEMVRVGGKSSRQFLIDAIAAQCGCAEGEFSTFSQLVNDMRYKASEFGEIYPLLYDLISYNSKFFEQEEANPQLVQLLSLPQFKFVITTTFDPIVENIMRKIHGDRLRVMCFSNDAKRNDDLLNGDESSQPTLYYMFGKVNARVGSYVVTDEDLLLFSRSWLSPSDCNSYTKPPVLSRLLANRYLMVLGHDYQDWLFRFFWYAIKGDAFGRENSGLLTCSNRSQELISFLNRQNAFIQHDGEACQFVSTLVDKIRQSMEGNGEKEEEIPVDGTDVFISYSRDDAALAEKLYEILTARGLRVWYDRQSILKGLDFMRQIENAIRHSTFFVPILTRTIIQQAEVEHPYRREWRIAVEHIQNVGGVSYCFPIFEEGMNLHDLRANIPNDITRQDSYSFTPQSFEEVAQNMADTLLAEMERRKKLTRIRL